MTLLLLMAHLKRNHLFSQEELNVYFEKKNKFLTVTRLERVIEISHWGNITTEEIIDLLHTEVLLEGLQ